MTAERMHGRTSFAFVRVDELRVAIPSARIARVRASVDASDESRGSRVVDLGTYFGRPGVGNSEEVLLSLDGSKTTLVATMPLVVAEVAHGDLHPVPEYLAQWARGRGIDSVAVVDGELSYVLDTDAFDREGSIHQATGTIA